MSVENCSFPSVDIFNTCTFGIFVKHLCVFLNTNIKKYLLENYLRIFEKEVFKYKYRFIKTIDKW